MNNKTKSDGDDSKNPNDWSVKKTSTVFKLVLETSFSILAGHSYNLNKDEPALHDRLEGHEDDCVTFIKFFMKEIETADKVGHQ